MARGERIKKPFKTQGLLEFKVVYKVIRVLYLKTIRDKIKLSEEKDEDECDDKDEENLLKTKNDAGHDDEEGLQFTGRLFGGLMDDIRRKAPWYLSDFTDALNIQVHGY